MAGIACWAQVRPPNSAVVYHGGPLPSLSHADQPVVRIAYRRHHLSLLRESIQSAGRR